MLVICSIAQSDIVCVWIHSFLTLVNRSHMSRKVFMVSINDEARDHNR